MENYEHSDGLSPGSFGVAEIWRYPVKSMGGEKLPEATISQDGVHLDRGWAVRDEELGVIRGARYIPRLLLCTARYVCGRSVDVIPHVEITLPDGETILSDDVRASKRLSDAIGRKLTLVSVGGSDQVHRAGPEALKSATFESEARRLFGLTADEPIPDIRRILEEKITNPVKSFVDAFAVNLLTTSSIARLKDHLPDSNLDVRRFRPNFLIDTNGTSYESVEGTWTDRTVQIGASEVRVIGETVRCIMISVEQPNLDRDYAIVRSVARDHESRLGVYARVVKAGLVRVGDPVCLWPSINKVARA